MHEQRKCHTKSAKYMYIVDSKYFCVLNEYVKRKKNMNLTLWPFRRYLSRISARKERKKNQNKI